MVKDRLFSFSMVIAVAFVLLVSLVISTVLSAFGRVVADALPGGAFLWQAANLAISLGVITVLFAIIFKVVPDIEIRWRDVWVARFWFTAALFSAGKYVLGLYLGSSTVASSYGAAGSVVALVIWVYYSSQLVFLGADSRKSSRAALALRSALPKNAMFVDAHATRNESSAIAPCARRNSRPRSTEHERATGTRLRSQQGFEGLVPRT